MRSANRPKGIRQWYVFRQSVSESEQHTEEEKFTILISRVKSSLNASAIEHESERVNKLSRQSSIYRWWMSWVCQVYPTLLLVLKTSNFLLVQWLVKLNIKYERNGRRRKSYCAVFLLILSVALHANRTKSFEQIKKWVRVAENFNKMEQSGKWNEFLFFFF